MDHVITIEHTYEDHSAERSMMSARAVRSAKLRKIPITRGTALAMLMVFAVLVLSGGTFFAWFAARTLGASTPIELLVGALACVSLNITAKLSLEYAPLRRVFDSLGTYEDMKKRRARLTNVVDLGSKLESAIMRFEQPDQLTAWGSLSALDDGIENLVALRQQFWLEIRNPETRSGTMPDEITEYIDFVDKSFHKAMHPNALAVAVQNFMLCFAQSNLVQRWQMSRLSDVHQLGFVEFCPRFDVRTNVDWAMLNAWCISGQEHLGGSDPTDVFLDEAELVKLSRSAFLAWWDTPREKRRDRLVYDRVLVLAPAVVYSISADRLELESQDYPISSKQFSIVDATGAPVEYVQKLWETASAGYSDGRMQLRRVVHAARLLDKHST